MNSVLDYTISADNTDEVIEATEQNILRALEICGLIAEGYAQVRLTEQKAVDTGLLRNSVTHAIAGKHPAISNYTSNDGKKKGTYSGTMGDKDELAVYIGTNVEYAPYIEYGTGTRTSQGGRQTPWTYQNDKGDWHRSSGMQARPYLRPAIANHVDEYKRIIENELKD